MRHEFVVIKANRAVSNNILNFTRVRCEINNNINTRCDGVCVLCVTLHNARND